MNLFESVGDQTREIFFPLVEGKNVRIEQIVSFGQSSPEGFWYDQEQAEWVVVLKGEASVRLESAPTERRLRPGDHLLIPAHERHRVESTSLREPTIWLAVFFDPV